ncbi:hypothetical protein RJ639_021722 [Escallonia herrerae]|uniref:separase n=1 Tax=Escallonia herrerae TaxID=1293975 RepID=A0AA89AH51_9ASTE|nr:hypothetical protein RJ639_021722 [Escallonia herrerae]
MDATTTESTLLAKLQSTDLTNTHHLFSAYLRPFSALLRPPNPKKPPKPSKTLDSDRQSTARSLAKQFLQLLNAALSILPKRLSESPKIHPKFAPELFETYRLCIDCLAAISSQLSCKPYSVQNQRVRLLHCLEAWGRRGEAEIEGLSVLESFKGIQRDALGLKVGKLKGRLVLDLGKGDVDRNFAYLVVEVVVMLVKCAAMSESKEEVDYRRVLVLVDEVTPWFRVLDAKAYEKLHRMLVTYLNKCALYLVGELTCFNGNLVRDICALALVEFEKSSMKDQLHKFVRRICSSILSQQDNQSPVITDILECLVDHMACECEAGKEESVIQLLEFVGYCASKCRSATTNCSAAVATYLSKLSVDLSQVSNLPIDLIIKLYSTGLFISDFISQVRSTGSTTMRSAERSSVIGLLLDNEDRFQSLSTSLRLFKSYHDISAKKNSLPSSAEYKDSLHPVCLPTEFNCESPVCTEKEKSVMLLYCSALKFMCQPLAELVNSERKDVIAGNEGVSFSTKLSTIQDVCHQFCDVYLYCHSALEREKDAFDDDARVLLAVAIAAFTLSFRTNRNIKEIGNFIKHVISADWIQAQLLKFLFASLHNIGVALYRDSKVKEASKALKLSCRASWTCVLHLCEILVDKSNDCNDDLTEDSILSTVAEACTKSAFLLDVLFQCGSYKVDKIIVDSLESWSVAEKFFKSLASPRALVKQWVKNDMYGNPFEVTTQVRYQLAEAYCLRALCTHEADPNSKQVFHDVEAALMWLNQDHSHAANPNDVSESALIVLYDIVDLLSVKGYLKFHPDIYEMIVRLFKRKNITLEKCLAILWEYRRLSHALCGSPVDESFIQILSQHCGELSKSMEFWKSCMMGSKPLQVGFEQSFSFMFSVFSQGSHHHGSSFLSEITVNEVKQAASDLISSALSYAKEAQRLRSKLFQDKFMYSVQQLDEVCDENGVIIQKSSYSLKTFQAYPTAATASWLSDSTTCDFQGRFLTPWNVLQCYLESTLQVGVIHEILGNGSEAEALLLWGENISCFQGLPVFKVAFSSVLGKLYRKQRLWDMAEKELRSAKQVLTESCSLISCLNCRVILEVSIDQQLGDLSRSRFINAENTSTEGLSCAENIFRSALTKLNLSEWGISASNPGIESDKITMFGDTLVREVKHGTGSSSSHNGEFPSKSNGPETKIQPRRSRKSKKEPEPLLQGQHVMGNYNSRMTRSKYRSSQKNEEIRDEVQIGKKKHASTLPAALHQRRAHSETECAATDFDGKISCVSSNIKCWHCLPLEVMTSGKCFGVLGEIHKAHEILLECILVLIGRNPFPQTKSSVPVTMLLDLIGKEICGDVAVEHAAVLYNICWFALQSYPCKANSYMFNDLNVRLPAMQQVSRLLAVLYVLSTSVDSFSLSSCEVPSASQWASYFHQASLGTHLNHQLFLHMVGKQKFRDSMDVESTEWLTIFASPFPPCCCRLAPESLEDLEGFVLNFFQGLPSATIICISLIGGPYASLLRDLLLFPSSVHAWILLSRLNSCNQPVVILLPVNSILEEAPEDDGSSSSAVLCEGKVCHKPWHCPWDTTVVDDVAPVFKLILEENFLSSSGHPLEDTIKRRSLWWMQRRRLDQCLAKFLRDLEDSWFGPWKYLLWGELSDGSNLDSVRKRLADNLKTFYNVDTHDSLLKVILEGAKYACQREECVSQLIMNKGCYICGYGYCDNKMSRSSSNTGSEVESVSQSIFKLVHETVHDIEEEVCTNREPVILVLDYEVQMLPWENIPILRNQEVYRMPSVGSISATFDRCCHLQENGGTDSVVIPLIDPLDAFYLLNPSGDLSSTEVEFENWFKDQNLQGKTGITPTIEELILALTSHDLFIYMGHGSGMSYPISLWRSFPRCNA